MSNLFGEEKPVPDRKDSDPAVKRVIDKYYTMFRARFGFRPKISGGKDGKLVKDMVSTWGEEDVLLLVDQFFSSRDARVLRCDYSIGALSSLAQGIMIDITAGRVDATSAQIEDAVSRAASAMQRGSQK